MGLGLAALGRPGYINIGHQEHLGSDRSKEGMESNARSVLDAAWESGIRYFDAARSYGLAEYFLSTWLNNRKIPKDEITIASKWGYVYTADWRVHVKQHEVKRHTLKNFKDQLLETQELLGSYLNLYQIHSATLESGVLTNTAVLNAMAHLKECGIKLGLSVSGIDQAKTIDKSLEIKVDGIILFDAVQATWNIMETSATNALKEAKNLGMLVIVKEALANGRILNPGHKQQHIFRHIYDYCEQTNCTLDAFALAVPLSKPYIDIVLSGASNAMHLRSNVKSLLVKPDSLDLKILQELVQEPATYWKERSQLSWN